MSPVADLTGPVSEISPHLFRSVHMKGRAGSVPEISVIKRAGNFAISKLQLGYRDENRMNSGGPDGMHRLALPAVFSTL